MHLVRNEQTKLTATWLNTLASALIAAGAFAPAAAIVVGFAALPISLDRVVALANACVLAGAAIHWGARLTLRRLRE